MDPVQFRKLIDLVGEALERPEAERFAWLEAECRGDVALFDEACSLLAEASATSLHGMTARLQAQVVRAAGQTLAESNDAVSHAGERVGAYRLVKEIGHGGMGTVYLAERDDDAYRARVAIKFVRGRLAVPELERRFRAERQILADLNHPNIARLLDGGTATDGTPYLVMEYLEGEPIDVWCERRALGVDARVELFLHVCDAVAYAHRAGVIHRDIKPANILVTPDGTPKLLDFGIAKLLGGDGDSGQTGSLLIMTPSYASPEQVKGEPLSTATDVYSLGVVLYELLADHPPLDLHRASFSEIERRICHVKPAPPSDTRFRDAAWRRELLGPLDGIVLRALEKEAARRHASIDALSGELRRYLSLPTRSRVAALGFRVRRLARRPVVLAGAGAFAIVAALISMVARQRIAAAPTPLGGFEFLAVQEASAAMLLPFRVHTGDVNADGRGDLIWNHAGATSNQTRVALGTADGTFAFQSSFTLPHTLLPSSNGTRELVVGDFNGDGAADLVWCAFVQRSMRIHAALSNGDGSFRVLEPQIAPPRWGGPWRAHVADVDRDARDDLVFNALGQLNLTRLARWTGDGSFREFNGSVHVAQGWTGYAAYLGDVDGDERVDIIWNDVPAGMNRIYVARLLPSLEMIPWQDHPVIAAGVGPRRSYWAGFATHTSDIDGDGRTDMIWIAANRDPIVIHRALGQPTAQFRFLDAQHIMRPAASDSLAVATGDFNGDGRTDLLLYEPDGETNRFWIGLGTRGASFVFAPEAYQRPAAVGEGEPSDVDVIVVDADGDGRSDIVWSDRTYANRVYVALSRPATTRR